MKKQITVILGVVTLTTLSLLIAFPSQVMQWLSPVEETVTFYGEIQQSAELEAPLLAEDPAEIADLPADDPEEKTDLPADESSQQEVVIP
jgi:hypothetical protein